jgi:hypothetical protein
MSVYNIMVYTYHTTIKNKVIEENGVVDFVAAVNTEVGVKIITHNMLYNYFTRPEKMKISVVRNLPITRV